MILLDINQDTPEWHELRRKKIGASDCPVIQDVSPYKKKYQLMEEKLLGKGTGYSNESMRRGKDVEPLARVMISKLRGTNYQPVVGLNPHADYQIASFDGWDGESFIEIKCPKEETFNRVKSGDIPIEYFWQVQHECCVANTSFGWLDVIKAKWIPEESRWEIEDHFPTKIAKDEKAITELLSSEWEFYQKMINFEYPVDDRIKPVERWDKEAVETIEAAIKAKQWLETAKEQYEIVREGAIYIANEIPFKCNGAIVRRMLIKGEIDYKRMMKEHNINPETYRGPGRVGWRLELPKDKEV